jgi:Spy/CpxP family protein refolding chaperone
MFGLIVGTLCLIALVITVRRRHLGHAYGGCGGPPFGYGPWHRGSHHHAHGHGFHGHGFRAGLHHGLGRMTLAHLETTPGQEKVIGEVVDRLYQQVRAQKPDWEAAQNELAKTMASDGLDEAALDAVLTKYEKSVALALSQLKGALSRVHETLDARQRERLAELIADGSLSPSAFRRGGF